MHPFLNLRHLPISQAFLDPRFLLAKTAFIGNNGRNVSPRFLSPFR